MWLNRAEQAEDVGGEFIFLWVAFNAVYAQELGDSGTSDKSTFIAFLQKLCDLDTSKRIDDLIWKEFSGSIRTLLDNSYVFHLLMDNPNALWGDAVYPVVDQDAGHEACAPRSLDSPRAFWSCS